jgi:hypothetical protein
VHYTADLVLGWLLPITFLVWILRFRGLFSIVLTYGLVVYAAYVTWTGGDWVPWLRYYLPILPIAAIMATELANRLGNLVQQRRALGFIRPLFVLAVLAVISGTAMLKDYPAACAQQYVESAKGIALWVKTTIPPHYHMAVVRAGAVPYYADRPIIDLMGLTDWETAHWGQTDLSGPRGHQRHNAASVLRRRPEVVLCPGMFYYPPSIDEVLAKCSCPALVNLCGLPEFRRLYDYHVVKVDEEYMALWVRRDVSGELHLTP